MDILTRITLILPLTLLPSVAMTGNAADNTATMHRLYQPANYYYHHHHRQ